MITLEMMPPLMFGGLILAMLIGFPVAFTLAAVGFSFGFLAIHLGFFDLNFLQAIPGRIFGSVLANELLLAIPFFTFMGAILERCGLAEDMLDSMGQLFGPIRGGLGYSVIIVGFILGAITGTVAAQVIAMALISMPVMLRYGYNVRYITGVLAASGTITQLVPPSLVLIVMADQLGKSVGDMYLGAWGPSVLQIALFAGYTFFLGLFLPHHVPAVPKDARTLTGWPLWRKCLMGIIPSAVLIFVVLGTMMLGLATPTEAGAMGLPDLHQPLHLLPGILPRLLRDRLHHPADGGADRAEGAGARGWAGCRVDLVRRHALRQHADVVPASAVRIRAVLSARRCAEGGQEFRHLLGGATLDRPAGDHGRDRDRLPHHGDGSARQAAERRSGQDQDRGTGNRTSAAGFRSGNKTIASRGPRLAGDRSGRPRFTRLIPFQYQQTSN